MGPIIFLCWLIVGFVSFAWIWTQDANMRVKHVPLWVGASLLGPILLIAMLMMHLEDRVVLRKRSARRQ